MVGVRVLLRGPAVALEAAFLRRRGMMLERLRLLPLPFSLLLLLLLLPTPLVVVGWGVLEEGGDVHGGWEEAAEKALVPSENASLITGAIEIVISRLRHDIKPRPEVPSPFFLRLASSPGLSGFILQDQSIRGCSGSCYKNNSTIRNDVAASASVEDPESTCASRRDS